MTDTSSAHRSRVRIEPSPKWVRAYLGGIAIADSTRAQLVWEIPYYPTYYFPAEDVRTDLLVATGETKRSPSRGDGQLYDIKAGDRVAERAAVRHLDSPVEELRDLVTFVWDALDHWFEENEEVRVHARSPYTRVDTLASDRHVQVLIDGETVADSTNATLLFETGLPTRYYLPKPDVRMDLMTPTDSVTSCPYKGNARYWSITVGDTTHDDFVWGYDFPLPESIRVAGLVCFYNEKVDLVIDGVPIDRPKTPFS
jgi:uncharacterized protein (DUF427 family)